MTADVTVPDLKLPVLVNGKRVRFRTPQMILWGVIAAALGSALVAGVYFGLFQVRWTIAGRQLFYLKPWFDGGMGLFRNASWVLYRHGERDLLEPAVATMGVKTLLAKPKWWSVRVPTWRIAVTPPLLVALAVALAAGGVWLLDFGLPGLWHRAQLGTVTAPPWISHSSWQVIILGIGIGLVLHRLWAPVGATLQGALVDPSVDRHKLGGRIPLWATKPISPPVLRERWWWWTDAHDETIEQRDPASRALIAVIVVVGVLLTLLGLLAQHWIGLGHSVPYLAP